MVSPSGPSSILNIKDGTRCLLPLIFNTLKKRHVGGRRPGTSTTLLMPKSSLPLRTQSWSKAFFQMSWFKRKVVVPPLRINYLLNLGSSFLLLLFSWIVLVPTVPIQAMGPLVPRLQDWALVTVKFVEATWKYHSGRRLVTWSAEIKQDLNSNWLIYLSWDESNLNIASISFENCITSDITVPLC